MTNEELNKWLAEFMGWKAMYVITPTHGPWMSDPIKEYWYVDASIPVNLPFTREGMRERVLVYYKYRVKTWNPTEDQNQAFECEGMLPKSKYRDYVNALIKILGIQKTSYCDNPEYFPSIFKFKHADSLVICKAIYKIMEGI